MFQFGIKKILAAKENKISDKNRKLVSESIEYFQKHGIPIEPETLSRHCGVSEECIKKYYDFS